MIYQEGEAEISILRQSFEVDLQTVYPRVTICFCSLNYKVMCVCFWQIMKLNLSLALFASEF